MYVGQIFKIDFVAAQGGRRARASERADEKEWGGGKGEGQPASRLLFERFYPVTETYKSSRAGLVVFDFPTFTFLTRFLRVQNGIQLVLLLFFLSPSTSTCMYVLPEQN